MLGYCRVCLCFMFYQQIVLFKATDIICQILYVKTKHNTPNSKFPEQLAYVIFKDVMFKLCLSQGKAISVCTVSEN